MTRNVAFVVGSTSGLLAHFALWLLVPAYRYGVFPPLPSAIVGTFLRWSHSNQLESVPDAAAMAVLVVGAPLWALVGLVVAAVLGLYRSR